MEIITSKHVVLKTFLLIFTITVYSLLLFENAEKVQNMVLGTNFSFTSGKCKFLPYMTANGSLKVNRYLLTLQKLYAGIGVMLCVVDFSVLVMV